jgi:hypothetical protein
VRHISYPPSEAIANCPFELVEGEGGGETVIDEMGGGRSVETLYLPSCMIEAGYRMTCCVITRTDRRRVAVPMKVQR